MCPSQLTAHLALGGAGAWNHPLHHPAGRLPSPVGAVLAAGTFCGGLPLWRARPPQPGAADWLPGQPTGLRCRPAGQPHLLGAPHQVGHALLGGKGCCLFTAGVPQVPPWPVLKLLPLPADAGCRVKRTTEDALDNSLVPFARVAEECAPTRDASASPIFQVMFVLQERGPFAARALGQVGAVGLQGCQPGRGCAHAPRRWLPPCSGLHQGQAALPCARSWPSTGSAAQTLQSTVASFLPHMQAAEMRTLRLTQVGLAGHGWLPSAAIVPKACLHSTWTRHDPFHADASSPPPCLPARLPALTPAGCGCQV